MSNVIQFPQPNEHSYFGDYPAHFESLATQTNESVLAGFFLMKERKNK